MKKLMYVAAALLLLAGCKKEAETTTVDDSRMITLTATIGDSGSKVTPTLGSESVSYEWEADDLLWIFNNTGISAFSVSSRNGNEAQFRGLPLPDMSSYHVIYSPTVNESMLSAAERLYGLSRMYDLRGRIPNPFNPRSVDLSAFNSQKLMAVAGAFGITLPGTGTNVDLTQSTVKIDYRNGTYKPYIYGTGHGTEIGSMTYAPVLKLNITGPQGTVAKKITCSTKLQLPSDTSYPALYTLIPGGGFNPGVSLSSTPKTVYFSVPSTLQEGFTLTIYGNNSDTLWTKTTNNTRNLTGRVLNCSINIED